MDNTNLPAWYQSSKGPQMSVTIKAILGLLLPTLKVLFPNLTIVNEQVDAVIDAAMIILFGAYALYGYVRAKRAFQAQVGELESRLAGLTCRSE